MFSSSSVCSSAVLRMNYTTPIFTKFGEKVAHGTVMHRWTLLCKRGTIKFYLYICMYVCMYVRLQVTGPKGHWSET